MAATALPLALATSADAAPIARLSRDEIERGLDWRWQPPAIARLIAQADTTVLCAHRTGPRLAEVPGPLVGFGIMEFGDDRAHLLLLATAPGVRRQGLARRIVGWLEKSARTAGLAEIRLEVRCGNTGAQRFYDALGFERQHYLPGFYQGREAAYRMAKPLRAPPRGPSP